jgi:hypothetical protein
VGAGYWWEGAGGGVNMVNVLKKYLCENKIMESEIVLRRG